MILLISVSVGQAVSPRLFNGLRWRLLGPFRGGRVVAVAGVPGDQTTFYFGAVNGGIWKTSDAGSVWTPIFEGQPTGSIGALAVAPSEPSTIYAGTGESDIRSDLSSGNGVYKSIDGGRTWVHLGLEETRQISRIVVDPQDSRVVYVGALGHAYGPNAERGVFKSVDGGLHWLHVLAQGPEIGVSDLAISSGNPHLLFAGTWHTQRPPWTTYAPIDGPGGGLFRSQDAGTTWSRLEGNGLPEGNWGRVGIDVAPNGERVYALIEAKKAGLYRSDNGGNSWILANADPRVTSRAWYFGGITIDPQNADSVYIPNVALYRCEDGGKTITILRGAPGGDDYHQIWIDPQNSSSLVLGTDQGTTISLDRGRTWSSWYNQPTAQLYHVITDQQFPYTVYGAQQDSGSAAVKSRTDYGQITPRDWFPAGPSESGYMALEANDANVVYQSGPYGTVSRFNRKTGLSQDVTPWPVSVFRSPINQRKYRAPWSPVLVSSPADPRALYFGSQYVMKTSDGGLHWETISPDLTGSRPSRGNADSLGPPTVANAKQRGYGVVSTIAPSPVERRLIWAGSNTGLIHLTKDGGKTWKDVTPPGLSDWSDISLIEASHFDSAVAYAAVNRARLDDQKPYLYRTRDYGSNWQAITEGIGQGAFLRAVREDPRRPALLFAATELGVYVSFDHGKQWQSLQLNLPVTSVRDLTVHGDDLVIATHGRSFWVLDNITPLRQVLEASKASRAWLFRPATTTRVDNDRFVGTPLPPEEPTAANPPAGAILDYYLNAPATKVKLEIFDAQKNLIRRFSSEDQARRTYASLAVAERWFPTPEVVETNAGMHRFLWDLAWGRSGEAVAEEVGDLRKPSGPKVVPGAYQVVLTVDGEQQHQTLEVVMDPRSPATPQILREQFQVAKQMFDKILAVGRVLAEIGSVEMGLVDLERNSRPSDRSLQSAISEGKEGLEEIASSKQPGSEGPSFVDAYKELASALRVVENGDRPAPSQAMAVYNHASQWVDRGMREWSEYEQTKLPQLNQQLRRANLAPITIEEHLDQGLAFLISE